jgi:large subunit ribosomal protein L10
MSESQKIKEREVNNLVEKIEKSKTLMIVSIKGLPAKQFQEIKKSIRDYAFIRVSKKNIMLRSLKKFGKESIIPLEEFIKENCAFVISNKEGYELAGLFLKGKTPINAKAGQIAPIDIEVKSGPTNLPPGPAISELGSLGIQIAVEDGKISIKANKVVLRKGQTINENAASILQKLNIKPFSVGLNPIAVYDVESEKIYSEISIDSEKARSELVNYANKSLGLAQKIVYYCRETIGYFLSRANVEANKLGELSPKENSDENKNNTEDKKDNNQLNQSEDKS